MKAATNRTLGGRRTVASITGADNRSRANEGTKLFLLGTRTGRVVLSCVRGFRWHQVDDNNVIGDVVGEFVPAAAQVRNSRIGPRGVKCPVRVLSEPLGRPYGVSSQLNVGWVTLDRLQVTIRTRRGLGSIAMSNQVGR